MILSACLRIRFFPGSKMNAHVYAQDRQHDSLVHDPRSGQRDHKKDKYHTDWKCSSRTITHPYADNSRKPYRMAFPAYNIFLNRHTGNVIFFYFLCLHREFLLSDRLIIFHDGSNQDRVCNQPCSAGSYTCHLHLHTVAAAWTFH